MVGVHADEQVVQRCKEADALAIRRRAGDFQPLFHAPFIAFQSLVQDAPIVGDAVRVPVAAQAVLGGHDVGEGRVARPLVALADQGLAHRRIGAGVHVLLPALGVEIEGKGIVEAPPVIPRGVSTTSQDK